jgi:hypothetical protein
MDFCAFFALLFYFIHFVCWILVECCLRILSKFGSHFLGFSKIGIHKYKIQHIMSLVYYTLVDRYRGLVLICLRYWYDRWDETRIFENNWSSQKQRETSFLSQRQQPYISYCTSIIEGFAMYFISTLVVCTFSPRQYNVCHGNIPSSSVDENLQIAQYLSLGSGCGPWFCSGFKEYNGILFLHQTITRENCKWWCTWWY